MNAQNELKCLREIAAEGFMQSLPKQVCCKNSMVRFATKFKCLFVDGVNVFALQCDRETNGQFFAVGHFI